MHTVQILLPLCDNAGRQFPPEILKGLQDELTARFGGLTAYSRAPAQGIWATGATPMRDDIVIIEVMVEGLDKDWWHRFRQRVEQTLEQEQLVIRAVPVEIL